MLKKFTPSNFSISLALVCACTVTPVFAQTQTAPLFEYSLEDIKTDKHSFEVKAVFNGQASKDMVYEDDAPVLKAIYIYDKNEPARQNEENDKIRQKFEFDTEYGGTQNWPELLDLNFDGYKDISLIISTGTLGDFYNYWLYNPETGLFEEAVFEAGEPVNAEIDTTHQQIVSSASTRLAYQSNVSIDHWQGNRLVNKSYDNGYFLPIKKDGEMLFCEIVTFYDDKEGKADYSVKVERLADGKIQLHGDLPLQEDSNRYDTCIDDAGTSRFDLRYALVMLWEKDNGKLKVKETIKVTDWIQTKDKQGKLIDEWCPVIPYVDLDNNTFSTFVLDYPSSNTELKQCESTNPMKKKK